MTGKLSFIIKTCLGQYSAQMAQPLHQVSIIIISGKVVGRTGRAAVFKLPDVGEAIIITLSFLSDLVERYKACCIAGEKYSSFRRNSSAKSQR